MWIPHPDHHVSTAIPGFNFGIYSRPDYNPIASFYVSSVANFATAAWDAYERAVMDPASEYFVTDFATGAVVYSSREPCQIS